MLTPSATIDLFRERAGLDDDRIQQGLRLARQTGESLDRALVAAGVVSERQMLEVLSQSMEVPFIESLWEARVPESFVARVPIQFARNHALIATGEENGQLVIASAYPLDIHPLDELAHMLQRDFRMVFTTRGEIAALVNRAYQEKVDVVDEMLEDLDLNDMESLSRELGDSQDLLDLANRAPIIKLVNMFLFQALKMRASDVHVQPYEDHLQVRYRIDGILYDMMTPPKKVQEAIISRIKVMGKMDIAERRLPQDGRTTLHLGDNEIDVRISSLPTSHGERVVMRLLDRSARLYEMEELGFDPDILAKVTKLIRFTHGIVLLTGPTGSGKTTTLYSALKRLNSTEKNILTIEDPIEYHLPGISQIEVSAKKGLTFATGLRSIVRQDPDIIMVGEIRDLETATIAIQSALTGHLVFSTLHTNDAPGAMTRLLDLGVESYLVASSVMGVLAQRLIRLNCKHCSEPFVPDGESLAQVGLTLEEAHAGSPRRGRGCTRCFDTGYSDRTCIGEALLMNDHIREQVMQQLGASVIKQHAIAAGMRTLRMDGAHKVLRGLSTIDEVLRVTQLDTY